MGYYVNPEGKFKSGEKEKWLFANGRAVPDGDLPAWEEISKDKAMVCLINNGVFTAAAIAFKESEYHVFLTPDGRPRIWFSVDREKLTTVSDVEMKHFK